MKDESSNIHSPVSTRIRIGVTSSISQGARDYQEDAFGHWLDASGERLFAVVADGAGGHGGGAEASQAAIEYSAKAWQKATASAVADPEAFLSKWMKEAHLAVNEASAKIHRSARSVVVACLTDGANAHWVHAGDSRLLRFHDGKLVERTRDDSVVQVLFERGDITEEEMGTHPDQSRLLQSLGGEDAPTPRHGESELSPGDVLLLCSDGFWEHLKREELEKLAATPSKHRQKTLDKAVELAVRRAGPKADNTTAVMISFDEGESRPRLCWSLLVLLAAVAGFVAALGWTGTGGNVQELWKKLRQTFNLSSSQTDPSSHQDSLPDEAAPDTEAPSDANPPTPEIPHD